jgi:hypothetical protein
MLCETNVYNVIVECPWTILQIIRGFLIIRQMTRRPKVTRGPRPAAVRCPHGPRAPGLAATVKAADPIAPVPPIASSLRHPRIGSGHTRAIYPPGGFFIRIGFWEKASVHFGPGRPVQRSLSGRVGFTRVGAGGRDLGLPIPLLQPSIWDKMRQPEVGCEWRTSGKFGR